MLLLASLLRREYTLAFWSGGMAFALGLGAVMVAPIGCVVALVMWRYAYRRTAITDIDETFS